MLSLTFSGSTADYRPSLVSDAEYATPWGGACSPPARSPSRLYGACGKLLFVLLVLLGAAPVASGYCLRVYSGSKPTAKWKTVPVGFRISDNVNSEVRAAIEAAFATWAAAACTNLSFSNEGTFPIATTAFQHNQRSIYVYWFEEASGYPTENQFSAFTLSGHDNDGGIFFASIAVNAFAFQWNASGGDPQGVLDVQNEMTYLVGSVLGLTDSTAADTVMRPPNVFGDTSKRALKQDDIDAIVALYPESDTCQAPPPASDCVGNHTGGDGSVSAADGGTPIGDLGGHSSDAGSLPVDAGVSGDGRLLQGQSCQSSDNCSPGQSCSADGRCIAIGSNGVDGPAGKGGGCSAGDLQSVFSLWAGLLLTMGLFLLLMFCHQCCCRQQTGKKV